MGDEPETTQVKKIPSETPPLDKTLNNKCHNNVEKKQRRSEKQK